MYFRREEKTSKHLNVIKMQSLREKNPFLGIQSKVSLTTITKIQYLQGDW